MADWTERERAAIGGAEELRIAAVTADGSHDPAVPIWVVRAGDDLYIRSYRDTGARWYRRATASGRAHVDAGGIQAEVTVAAAAADVYGAVDDAYRQKYARYGDSYITPMTNNQAHATTLVLRPL